jgi:predicted Zn finger-like uncharacterized protein
MFTVCPKCGLMLVVTAADLRAAQGHVRCGRCRSVFNALDSLSETSPQESAPVQEAPVPSSAAAEPSQLSPTSASPVGTGKAEEPSSVHYTLESAPDEDVWVGPEEAPAPREPALTLGEEQTESAPPHEQPVLTPAEPPSPLPESPAETAPEPESITTDEAAPAEFELEPATESHTGAWFAASLVLLLVLAGQLVNHFRGMLATVPSVGPTVRAVYGALGIPIVPRWNVRAYQARQLGATVSGSNPRQITVRASIANRGPWPLPLPLLRVTLQDRYGRTIAARDISPRDYLPTSAPPAAMLPAGGRIDAIVAFENPGPQAIGFEIDACLREGGAVVCAHGPR